MHWPARAHLRRTSFASALLLALVVLLFVQSAASLNALPSRAPLAAGTYDGEWFGTTNQSLNIAFKVTNDTVTNLAVEFSLPGCSLQTETLAGYTSLTGNTFTASTLHGSVQGTFGSLLGASGTAQIAISNSSCSGSLAVTWVATRPSAPPTATATPTPPLYSITIGDFFFAPQTRTVARTSAIRWTNTGNEAHTITSPGLGDTVVQPGGTYTLNLNNAPVGTYSYYCRFHANMTGSIRVSSTASAPKRYAIPMVRKPGPPPTPTPVLPTPSSSAYNGS